MLIIYFKILRLFISNLKYNNTRKNAVDASSTIICQNDNTSHLRCCEWIFKSGLILRNNSKFSSAEKNHKTLHSDAS